MPCALHRVGDRGHGAREREPLVHPPAVPGKVDGNGLVAQPLEQLHLSPPHGRGRAQSVHKHHRLNHAPSVLA